ncbi:tetratricopeptide repeat protein [Roseomonas sp. WA12]
MDVEHVTGPQHPDQVRFLFSREAVERGHSVDYLAGGTVLLHLKVRLQPPELVINDCPAGVWGKETRLGLGAPEVPRDLAVDLTFREAGVIIRTAAAAATFDRCGDIRGAPEAVHPRTIERQHAPNPVSARMAEEPATNPPPAAPAGTSSAPSLTEALRAAAAGRDWTTVLALAAEGSEEALAEPAAAIAIARALIETGSPAKAELVLRRLLIVSAETEESDYLLGVALQRQGRNDEARPLLLRCLERRPREARYLFETGRCTAKCCNGSFGASRPQPELIDDAIQLLTRAAAVMRRDGRPHREIAALLQQKGLFVEALDALDEARRRSPGLVALALERARLLVRLDRIEEALVEARDALATDPESDSAGFTVRVLERWQDARRLGPLSFGEWPRPH